MMTLVVDESVIADQIAMFDSHRQHVSALFVPEN